MTGTDSRDASETDSRGTSETDSRSASGRLRADARDAGVLVRTELRARLRGLRGNTRQLAATAFLGLTFGLLFPLLAAPRAAAFGADLAGGSVPAGPVGAVLAALAALGLYLGGASGFTQNRLGTLGPLVRTSIPPTAVSLGRFVAEMAQAVALVVPAAVVLLIAVGIGAGTPVTPLALAAASLPVFLCSVVVGRLLGDALRYANRYLQVSLWTKALLFVGGTVAAYVGSQVLIRSRIDESAEFGTFSVPALLPGEPLQAYAAATLDPLAAGSRPLGVVVALGVVTAIPVCLAVALRAETRLLLHESPAGGPGEAGESRGVPWPFTATTSARVAWRYLLRTRRDPRMLAHLGPLLFGALGMVGSVFTDPESARLLGPPAAVIAGASLAGAAFCLNPLGDDSEQLPLLLTSAPSTAVLLRGRALAGMAPGLAVAVGIGTPLALVTYSVPAAVGQTLLAVALSAAGAGTALGIGALAPKFERREYMSVERAHPSMFAVVGYFFGGIAVGAVGLVLVFWTVGGASPLLALPAWGTYLAVLAVSGGGGYVYAVRTFDAFALDDV